MAETAGYIGMRNWGQKHELEVQGKARERRAERSQILRVMEAGIHFGMVGGTRNSHLSLLAVVRNTSFGRGE